MNDVMQKVFGVAHRRLAYSPGDKVRRIAAFALDLRVLDFLFTTFELKRLPSGSKSLFFFPSFIVKSSNRLYSKSFLSFSL